MNTLSEHIVAARKAADFQVLEKENFQLNYRWKCYCIAGYFRGGEISWFSWLHQRIRKLNLEIENRW